MDQAMSNVITHFFCSFFILFLSGLFVFFKYSLIQRYIYNFQFLLYFKLTNRIYVYEFQVKALKNSSYRLEFLFFHFSSFIIEFYFDYIYFIILFSLISLPEIVSFFLFLSLRQKYTEKDTGQHAINICFTKYANRYLCIQDKKEIKTNKLMLWVLENNKIFRFS